MGPVLSNSTNELPGVIRIKRYKIVFEIKKYSSIIFLMAI